MNKLLILLAFVFSFGELNAQKTSPLAINVYGQYVFRDKLNFDGFSGYVNDGFQYGIGLEYFIESIRSVELKYLRQDTRFPLFGPGGTKLNEGRDKGSVSYILIGGTNYFGGNKSSKAKPYGGFGLGIGILNADDGGSTTKFAWDSKLGLHFKTSSKVSFKLQATLQSITAAAGNDFYLTSIGPIAVPDYVSLFQFGLGGGLFYDF